MHEKKIFHAFSAIKNFQKLEAYVFTFFKPKKSKCAHRLRPGFAYKRYFSRKKMQHFKIGANPLVNGIFEFFSNISSFDADFSPKFLPKSKKNFLMKNHAFFCGQKIFFKKSPKIS